MPKPSFSLVAWPSHFLPEVRISPKNQPGRIHYYCRVLSLCSFLLRIVIGLSFYYIDRFHYIMTLASALLAYTSKEQTLVCVCVRTPYTGAGFCWLERAAYTSLLMIKGKCFAPILLRKLLLLNQIANPPCILHSRVFCQLGFKLCIMKLS